MRPVIPVGHSANTKTALVEGKQLFLVRKFFIVQSEPNCFLTKNSCFPSTRAVLVFNLKTVIIQTEGLFPQNALQAGHFRVLREAAKRTELPVKKKKRETTL